MRQRDPKFDLKKAFARHYFGADYDLGTARGKIVVDATGAEVGFGRAAAAQQGFEKSTKNTGLSAVAAGGMIAGAGVAIAGGLALAVNSAADFEQRMSAVKAVSGATGEEFDNLRNLALQLGADTKYSATEAAGAIEELVKAGLPVEDILNGAAKATTNLAAAGEVELAEAATIAANAMNAFNLEGKDMEHVADLIAGAANASAIDVSEFGMALQQSGAVASLVGLSFDDLSVAIAAMGNAGIKGSDAGTSLKTFLSNLQPTTEKQISLFRELGLVTEDGGNAFFDAEGKIKSMSEIAGVLNGAVGDMTEQQRMMALETMFGSDAIRAAAIIAGEGAEGMDALAASMGKVSAEEVAEERMNNFRGSLEKLMGSLETVAIQIGTPLLGGLRTVVDTFAEWTNKIGEMDPKLLEWGGKIAGIAAGVLILLGGLTMLIGMLGKIKAAMVALNSVLLMNPYVWLAIAVIALIAGLVLLYQKNEAFRESVQGVWEWIKSNVGPVIETVVNGFKAMVAAFQGDGITSDGFVGQMERIGVVARQVVEWVVNDLWPALQEAFDWIAEEGIPAVVDAWDWLYEKVAPVVEAFIELWGAIIPRVKQYYTLLFNIIKAAVAIIMAIWSVFGDNIMNVVEIAWGYIQGVISAAMQIIRGIIQVISGLIALDFGRVWEGIKAIVDGVWDAIYNTISTMARLVMQLLGGIWELITVAARNAWDWIQEKIGGVLAWIVDAVAAFGAWVAGYWNGFWSSVQAFFGWVWDNIISKIISAIGTIVSWVAGIPGALWGALWNAASALYDRGSALLQGLWDGAVAIWGLAWEWVKGIPGEIWDFFSGAGAWLYNIGKDIIQGLLDGMKDIWSDTVGWLAERGGIITSVKGPPRKDKKLLTENGMLIMLGLQKGMAKGWGNAEKWLSHLAPAINATVSSAALPAPSAVGSVTNAATIVMEFPNVGSAEDARDIEEALENSDVLSNLVGALRAGRKMG